MVVIGFDLGSDQCRISHCGRGGVTGLLNEESRRETPNMVQFTEDRRNIGPMAASQFMGYSKSTITDVCRFIGLTKDQISQEDLDSLTTSVSVSSDGELKFQVDYCGKAQEFTATEILGMLLGKLKKYAVKETKAKDGNVSAVIAIPASFLDSQVRAVQAAAEIAEIKILKLIPSTTASSLEYGLYKDDLPKEKPKHLAFVESGHSQTTASIISITLNKVRVRATAFDRKLGGRNFEDVLFNHFVKFIKENYPKNKGGLDVTSTFKATQILKKAVSKIKKSLSATAKVQHQIELITNGQIYDITLRITREEFEEMSKPLLEKFKNPVEEAIKLSGLKVADISEVQVLGGTTYIPALRAILQDVFKKPVSSSVNVLESVSRGAAIQGAILSPLIRLAKEFKVTDTVVHPIDLRWNKAEGITGSNIPDNPKKKTIYQRGEDRSAVFKSKFTKSKSFEIYAFYGEGANLPVNTNPLIGRYAIHLNTNKPTKVTIRYGYGDAGEFKVINAYYEEEEEYEIEKKVEITDDMDTSEDGEEEKKEEKKDKKEDKKDEKKEDKKEKKKEKKFKTVKEKKTRIKQVNLKVDTYNPLSIPKDQIKKWIKAEKQYDEKDKLVAKTEDAKNAVETYGYEVKDKVEYEDGELYEYLEASERESFIQALDDAVDWLYGDGENVSLGEYVSRLTELRKVGDPAHRRLREAKERQPIIQSIVKKMDEFKAFVVSEEEQYAHISAEERKKVSDKVDETGKFVQDAMAKLSALPKYQNPTVTCDQLKEKLKTLTSFCTPIVNTPVPKKEEKKEEKKDDKNADDKMEDEKSGEEETKKDDDKMEDEPKPE